MAARKPPRALRPLDAALARLAEFAAKGMPPGRMAREVDAIVAGWLSDTSPDDRTEVRERLGELRDELAAGVDEAEEQLADIDRSEPAAARHAGLVHAALVASRDAVERALAALEETAPAAV
ncbi:hypothetical protein [Siccirubricoccus phaeus]|uniref:hypothetical protein n=1 Tax=Siccirubricoccus phaeus TaxID=2595053 RepID=UPI0011F0A5EA|nr:hypothetical protein [Siccirubricoccus phaeus]